MNWVIFEIHNLPLIICGFFYGVLCLFSIVTGIIYAAGKRKLNPIELSDKFVKSFNNEKKLKEFTIKMGYITILIGLLQGLTSFSIFKGYNVYLNIFAIVFTVFSICSVVFKLRAKVNKFSIIKLIFYIIILLILLLNGINNYGARSDSFKYLKSTDSVKVKKIKEGYYFDGFGEESAIIFFPGARVQYTSYAELMYKFADNGIDCFMLSVPLNLAFFDINKPNRIIKKYEYNNWYIAGHSLGGVAANVYAVNNDVSGVIHFASYPTKKIPNNMKYISIYGSEDKVLNLQKVESSENLLPKNKQIIVIDGGNHAYFGSYGEQKGDGIAKISSSKQKDFVVKQVLKELN